MSSVKRILPWLHQINPVPATTPPNVAVQETAALREQVERLQKQLANIATDLKGQ